MHYHLSVSSSNPKTGYMPVSTSDRKTCPTSCPLLKKCYAERGNLIFHWNKLSRGESPNGTDWAGFLEKIKQLPKYQLWRFGQAGDLPGEGDAIDAGQLQELVRAQRGKHGFAYTHKPMDTKSNRDAVKRANDGGFTVNLSADGLNDADDLADLDVAPVVTLVPLGSQERLQTPKGRTVIICPNQTGKQATCATCALCQEKDRGYIIGFWPHGSGKTFVNEIAKQHS